MCHDPLYEAGVLGDTCHDELDHDTCEPGFVDSGNGCEPEDKGNENDCSNKIGFAGLKFPQV